MTTTKATKRESLFTGLRCVKCLTSFGRDEQVLKCPKCEGELEAVYDMGGARSLFRGVRRRINGSIWDFFPMLPIGDRGSVTSLGEGWTPLVKAEKLGRKLDLTNLYLKDETRNPTLSFKDRAISVAISKAVEWKRDTVVTASTGNLAAAVSAYSARAGLKAYILTAAATPLVKRIQTAAFGATVVPVEGATTDGARHLADMLVEKYGSVPRNDAFDLQSFHAGRSEDGGVRDILPDGEQVPGLDARWGGGRREPGGTLEGVQGAESRGRG